MFWGVFLVFKRSLMDFLRVFLVLKVRYEELKFSEVVVCNVLILLCCLTWMFIPEDVFFNYYNMGMML
jgi:hypothetical protein